MLDSNFILKLGKEIIQDSKSIDIGSLPLEQQLPYLFWIQKDPGEFKENGFLIELKKVTEEICLKSTLIEQKKATKTAILNHLLNFIALFYVLLYPRTPENTDVVLEDDHDSFVFAPLPGLTSALLDNYLNHISNNDQFIRSKGITNAKTFENSALISKYYSISAFIYLTLEECALNIGISNIKEKNKAFAKIMVDIIYPSIKNNNLNINPFDQLLTNQIFMKFIEEE